MSAHNHNWHVQVREEDQHFTNTCIEQIEDPLKAIMVKKKEEEIDTFKPKCLNSITKT